MFRGKVTILTVILMAMLMVMAILIAGCGGGGGGATGGAIPNTGNPSGGGEQPPTGPPVITGLTPTSGQVNSSVQISGNKFGPTKGSVFYNGTQVPTNDISSWTNNLIVAKVPTGATTGNVTVTNTQGTSNGMNFTVTVPAGNPPAITSLNPTSGNIGSQTTLTGTDFTEVTGATVNGTNAPTFSVINSTTMLVTIPAGASTGPIVVTHPSNGASNGVTFTVTNPPTITGLNPTSGTVGSQVIITGTNFNGTTVTFNGVAASFTIDSPTQITATVPTGATTGNVVVTTAAGPSNGIAFTVITTYTYSTKQDGMTGNTHIKGASGTTVYVTDTLTVKVYNSNLGLVNTINDPSGGGIISATVNGSDVIMACGTKDIYKNGTKIATTSYPIVDIAAEFGSYIVVLTRNINTGYVEVFNLDGTVAYAPWSIASSNTPLSIAISTSGYVWIADWGTNNVRKYSISGTHQQSWGGFNYPKAIDVGSDGKIYIANAGSDSFLVYDSNMSLVGQYIGSHGSGNGQFLDMDGIGIFSGGQVVISDFGNKRLSIFTP